MTGDLQLERPDEREIFRYLGYGRKEPDSMVTKTMRECMARLEPQLTPRYFSRTFDLHRDTEILRIESMEIRSRSLSANLEGCDKVCLMAATIGFAPDRLAQRASALGKMSEAVMYQAIGAAFIESWCDTVNRAVSEKAQGEGWYSRTRFSPGYGDFSLDYQRAFFDILQIPGRIGVNLTESLMMMPSKSVTALIGLSRTPKRHPAGGNGQCGIEGTAGKCERCENAPACSFRQT